QSVTHRVELSGKLIFDVTDKSRQRRDRVRQCVELFFYRGRPQRSFRLFSDQTSICHCSPACCCRNDYSAQYSFSGVVTAQHSCRAKAPLLEMARTGRSSAFKLANSASRLGAGFWFGRDARGQISVSQGHRLRIRSVGDTTTVRPRAKGKGNAMATNSNIRAALERHWAASDANDFNTEHQIYREDAVLEYPQSGERIRGRDRIQASRMAQPNYKRFSVRRIIGGANLWVSEFILTYDGQPSYTVSIMEFEDEQVIRETQYFADPFQPGPFRSEWVERM